jgi:hypothetical protein
MATRRFAILFTGANRAMAILGLTPERSYLELDDESLEVRMSWAFRATVPRSSIRAVRPYTGAVYGWGAHGWRGRWLVNGSSQNIVEIEVDPPAAARTMVFPLRLRLLRVSVTEPDELLAALAT